MSVYVVRFVSKQKISVLDFLEQAIKFDLNPANTTFTDSVRSSRVWPWNSAQKDMEESADQSTLIEGTSFYVCKFSPLPELRESKS